MRTILHPTSEIYRIPDREIVKTKIDKSLLGKYFFAKRIITRLGYPVNFNDFIYTNELKEEIKKIVYEFIDISRFETESNSFTGALLALRLRADQLLEDGVPSHWRYKALKRLQNQFYDTYGVDKSRSIWYRHFTTESWFGFTGQGNVVLTPVKIVGKKGCWTGDYYAPSSWGSEDGYDSDPGGLNNSTWHNLYQIEYRLPFYEAELRWKESASDLGRNVDVTSWHDDGYSHISYSQRRDNYVYLHPNDIVCPLTPDVCRQSLDAYRAAPPMGSNDAGIDQEYLDQLFQDEIA